MIRQRGRGAVTNPKGRFERFEIEVDEYVEPDPTELDDETPRVTPTVYLRDGAKSVISRNQSPDVPFDASLNPYRGCEHGCSYCYARPTHELLGFSAGLDFESKILVKEDAPELLRRELTAPSWQPTPLGLSGVTDAYQPIERKLGITRRCVEVLVALRQPVMVITKSPLVARDSELFAELARHDAVSVAVSITSLDPTLSAIMEPRAGHPKRRLSAIRQLTDAGVPTGVLMAPIVPAINDHEIPAVLDAAAEAGASFAGYTILRLPGAVEEIFDAWLDEHFAERKDKILNRLRSLRGGEMHDGRFGHRMRGQGVFAEQVRSMFAIARRRHAFRPRPTLSTHAFRRPNEQLSLFGGG